jgi:alginate O-acetyltransferase complex protein AlgI
MLFNSIDFGIFLIIVFILYWFVANKSLSVQNSLLLAASYFFYACWDWRFLFLLLFSTLLDYFTGIKMSASPGRKGKKVWFLLSVCINLGFLGVFKYFNFFAQSFAELIGRFGLHVNTWSLQVILPVGISFYTFHGLSYVIDIYYDRIKPEKRFVDYAVFVSFFPLLVAGPIERATHLLPQIKQKRTFDYTRAADGLRQILWGLFKKVAIADPCAEIVNKVFAHNTTSSGSNYAVGAIFFAIQIYCDFSGYSDIALGTARLFGIELLRNFSYPYFSRDIAEFWRRWHISLSSWFRDYLYIPLGGSRVSTVKKIRNVLLIFLISGFWHGANWTFLVWGLLNALYILPSVFFATNRNNLDIVAKGRVLPSLREILAIGLTFGLTVFAWIFFRAESVRDAFRYISTIFSRSLLTMPLPNQKPKGLIALILVLFLLEWIGRENNHALSKLPVRWPAAVRWLAYFALVFAICSAAGTQQQFIYFQF